VSLVAFARKQRKSGEISDLTNSPFTADRIPRRSRRTSILLTCGTAAGPNKLTAEEIFVLIAACHLHDIGMQLGLVDARENHAEYAHKLILYSSAQIGPEQRRVTLSISNPNARVAIAEVARGHWTDFALRLPEEDYIFENERGRLKLLGLLLATADLLDTSAVRAGYFRSAHRLFDLAR